MHLPQQCTQFACSYVARLQYRSYQRSRANFKFLEVMRR